ncbi:MAG TPA: DUF1329 domain-containing protein [Nevskiaceae bacterium]|nr:DUF1329 domain-containing protein [Nevskiaceae bacterium]
MIRRLASWLGIVALGLAAQQSYAKVDAAEAAKLGKELTPIGAEKAASKDGTIPEWTGGLPQKGALKGEYPDNPETDAEKPLFTITQQNVAQYADKLTVGHKELLKRFPTYKMNVYKTHRNVAFPQFIYDATKTNATNCAIEGTDILENCKLGFPFPIPKSGAEVIWNHRLKWRGNNVRRYNNQLIVQPSGAYQLTKLVEDVSFSYANSEHPTPLTKGSGEFLRYLSQTIAPPRLAGTFILVHEKMGTGAEGRAAWLYSPGLRRIRRAPTVQYDNPYEGTDGNQFYDQVDLFNGALDRYNWKIVGKKEMYLPYDSYVIGSPKVKFKQLATPKHLNQDFARYELHRYWIIEANVRPGTNHTFKRRTFYVDEDSWDIEAVDCYDNKDQLYKFQEGHLIYAPNIQTATGVPEIIYDFFSGRYFITALANEDQANDLTVKFSPDYFTADAVQKKTLK